MRCANFETGMLGNRQTRLIPFWLLHGQVCGWQSKTLVHHAQEGIRAFYCLFVDNLIAADTE